MNRLLIYSATSALLAVFTVLAFSSVTLAQVQACPSATACPVPSQPTCPAVGACPRNLGPLEEQIAVINSRPMDFYGEQVILSGQVRHIQRPGLFTIGDSSSPTVGSILVLSDTDPSVAIGDTVQVTGVIHSYTSDMRPYVGPQYGPRVAPDVSTQHFETWNNRPSIVANEVLRLKYVTPPPAP